MSIASRSEAASALSIAFAPAFGSLAPRYDLVLCDVWGVLHDGIAAFPEAGDALRRFRLGGGRVVLVSNAPRPGSAVGAQLDLLGVPQEAYDAIVTSGDLTRAIIAERGNQPVHHLGPDRDLTLFEGLPARLVSLGEAEYVVCTGLFDDERDIVADYDATLRTMRDRGLWMVCANPDLVVERGNELVPCAGALAAAYEAMGGETYTGGKPHRPIYEAAASVGVAPDRERILAIGDAIRTDVTGARGFGIDVLLVARGIHAGDLGYRRGEIDLDTALAWLAEQEHRPTAVTPELAWT